MLNKLYGLFKSVQHCQYRSWSQCVSWIFNLTRILQFNLFTVFDKLLKQKYKYRLWSYFHNILQGTVAGRRQDRLQADVQGHMWDSCPGLHQRMFHKNRGMASTRRPGSGSCEVDTDSHTCCVIQCTLMKVYRYFSLVFIYLL